MTNLRKWVNSLSDKELLEKMEFYSIGGCCKDGCPVGLEKCRQIKGKDCNEVLEEWAFANGESDN